MSSFAGRRILIVAPHPDDEVIAAGGLISRAKAEGAWVFVLLMATGTEEQYGSSSWLETRMAELQEAMRVLSVDDYEVAFNPSHHLRLDALPRKELVDVVERKARLSLASVRPDIFIFPGASYSQDHNAAFESCMTATRPYPMSLKHSPAIILLYSHFDEQFWNTQVTSQANNFWVDISDHFDAKERALSCYRSQMKQETLHWRTIENILAINRLIGKRVGVEVAEEFRCIKCLT